MSIDPRYQRKIERLAGALQASTGDSVYPLDSVSDELADLLWDYATDDLTEADEEKLWELAALEPSAVSYFCEIVATMGTPEWENLGVLPSNVLARLSAASETVLSGSPQVSAALKGMQKIGNYVSKFIADLSLEVTENFLRVTDNIQMPLTPSLARSSDEDRTSFTCELLRPFGIIEVIVDHAGSGRCHINLRVTKENSSHDVQNLRVRLISANQQQRESQGFHDSAVHFADVECGNCIVIIEQPDGNPVDQIHIALHRQDSLEQ